MTARSRVPAVPRRLVRLLPAALAFAAAVAGCGDDAPAPLAPAPPPPGIAEVYPSPRATRVPFDVTAWARFEAPLDPASVNDRTVFFKLDTKRVPAEVRWEAATNRVLVRPLEEPAAARTHTVVLSTAVHTADGTPLARPYEWQFRMIGVRVPAPSNPAPGAALESPFTTAEWAGTEPAAGEIVYEFYVGGDSVAVAARPQPPRRVTTSPVFLPDSAWALGSRRWWTVTTVNRTLGEREDGPVNRFDVLPAGTPMDSVTMPIARYGFRSTTGAGGCVVAQLLCGSGFVCGALWERTFVPGRKLAYARLETNTSDTTVVVTVRAPDRAFDECQLRYPGPPFPDPALPALGTSTRARGSRRLVWRSTMLAAQIERALRLGSVAGFLFTASRVTDLVAVNQSPTPPRLHVAWYRTPEPAAGAAAPARVAGRPRSRLDPSVTGARRPAAPRTR